METESQRKAFLASRVKQPGTDTQPVDNGGRKLANGAPLSNFPPKTQAFIERHPKAFTDPAYLQKAIAAAGAAINLENLPDESDEYFAYIEEKLGERAAAAPATKAAPTDDLGVDILEVAHTPANPQPPAAGPGAMSRIAAAPPTRSTPTGTGSPRVGVTRLSAQEAEVARELYPGLSQQDAYQKYAQGKQYMKERATGYFAVNN
jgi:hypothetical protein